MEYLQQAQEALQDSSWGFGLMGTSPDHLLAAQFFEMAANKFKTDKEFGKSADAFIQAAKCLEIIDNPFLAGKALESAALLFNNLGLYKEAGGCFHLASRQFSLSGSFDKASELLLKAALAMEAVNDYSQGLELLFQVIKLVENAHEPFNCLDLYTKAIGFAIRANQIRNAIEFSVGLENQYRTSENGHRYARQVLSSIILYLILNDGPGAISKLNSSNLYSCPEEELIKDLINAFGSGKQEKLDTVISDTAIIPYLDSDIFRIAQNIKVGKATMESIQDQVEQEGYC